LANAIITPSNVLDQLYRAEQDHRADCRTDDRTDETETKVTSG
jgi:hypothetical protein